MRKTLTVWGNCIILMWCEPKKVNDDRQDFFCVFVLLLLTSLKIIINCFCQVFLLYYRFFPPCFSYADALLADLENTGSPLARCPVLLTSDPPKHSEAEPEEPTQTRPAPPAYTPQQVEQQTLGMSRSESWVQCSSDSLFAVFSLRQFLLPWKLPRSPTQTNCTGQ